MRQSKVEERSTPMIEKRIGVIIPSLNVVVEDDCRRFVPPSVGYHIARVRLGKTAGRVTQQALIDSGADAITQAGFLADATMDAIAFNCTGASLSDGPEGARKLARAIGEAAGTPTTTTILSVVRALRQAGVRRLVHVCPFTPEFGKDEADFLTAEGFEVVSSVGLNFTDAKLAAKLTPEEIFETAVQLDTPKADGIFLACANVRAWEAVPALEKRLGKPVITSNQAVVWDLLDMVGATMPQDETGRLFSPNASAAA
jgi:maleate isomerase